MSTSSLTRRTRHAAGRLRGVLLLIAVALLAALAPTCADAQETALHIGPGERVAGDIATFSRAILVDGAVMGDVTSWGGPITVNGYVGGDVVSYASTVVLGAGARVDGHVLALGGNVEQAPGARVARHVFGDEPGADGALASLLGPFVGGAVAPAGPAVRAIVGAILALISLLLVAMLTLAWPRRLEGASRTLRHAPGRSSALGLVTTLLLAMLVLPFAGLMAATLLGLPLTLLVLLLLQIPFIAGIAVVGQVYGRALARRLPRSAATVTVTLLLLAPTALIGIASPPAGAALFYLLASPGLGAALFSRGGAYAPSSPRP